MKIPIQNIYYLLCYAWDKLDERDVVAVESLETTNLVNLFAKVLVNGTNHLLKRGFDRGYVQRHEWMSRLRGRVCFPEAIRRNATLTARLPCDFDELSYDVLHNQILKTTMRRLTHTSGLSQEYAESLSSLCRMFSEVQDVELSNRVFGQVQLHRNNQFYDFLLKVCELIYRNLLVSEKSGNSKFMDFVQDERQMAVLFEHFVRNFYRIEQKHHPFWVKREDIMWRLEALDASSMGLLPKMQTDISLSSENRKIIIDCKFTPEATKTHHGSEKLRSAHLYQIFAYLNNQPEGKLTDNCEVMLLYPTVDKSISGTWTDPKGRKMAIRTINLNQEWQGIHSDLLKLVA